MRHNHSHLLSTTLNFTTREIKTRYAESLFGSLWIVIYPLTFALISAGIFSIAFRDTIGVTPYFLFVFVGFMSWFWFSQTVVYATRSLIANRDLILNNKFPTESIIFSIVLTNIIDYSVNIIVLTLLMALFHQKLSMSSLSLFLLISVCQLVFQTGVSLVSAVLHVFFRDWRNILDIVLQLLFYCTPIVYSLSIVPTYFRTIIELSPMTQFVLAYRMALFQESISLPGIWNLMGISTAVFILGYLLYKKTEYAFAEHI